MTLLNLAECLFGVVRTWGPLVAVVDGPCVTVVEGPRVEVEVGPWVETWVIDVVLVMTVGVSEDDDENDVVEDDAVDVEEDDVIVDDVEVEVAEVVDVVSSEVVEDEVVVGVGLEVSVKDDVDGEGGKVVEVLPEMTVMTLMISVSIISHILIKYKMNLTLDSIVCDMATSILSVSRVWLRVRTLADTTLVPSSTKNEERLKRNSEMETTLTAEGTVAKLKSRVAMTRVLTSRRMVLEV